MRKKLHRMNRIAAVCVTLSAVLTLIAISFAAYTSLSTVKRVVTVKGTEQLFTSNVLLPYNAGEENKLQGRVISFAETMEKKIVSIEIANYLQDDRTKYDSFPISYVLKASIIDLNGNPVSDSAIYEQYKINGAGFTNNPVTFEGYLPGGPNKDTYLVEIPEEFLSAYRIKVTATPNGSKYQPIGRILATATELFTPHWVGNFLESERDAVGRGEKLGIINYQISGHMEETCTLSWNSARVDIDPRFLETMGITPEQIVIENGTKSVKLKLGGEGKPERYDIMFFRTYSVNDLNEDWNTISQYITFESTDTGA